MAQSPFAAPALPDSAFLTPDGMSQAVVLIRTSSQADALSILEKKGFRRSDLYYLSWELDYLLTSLNWEFSKEDLVALKSKSEEYNRDPTVWNWNELIDLMEGIIRKNGDRFFQDLLDISQGKPENDHWFNLPPLSRRLREAVVFGRRLWMSVIRWYEILSQEEQQRVDRDTYRNN